MSVLSLECVLCTWLCNIVGDVLSGRILHGTLACFAIAVIVRIHCGVSLASHLTSDWLIMKRKLSAGHICHSSYLHRTRIFWKPISVLCGIRNVKVQFVHKDLSICNQCIVLRLWCGSCSEIRKLLSFFHVFNTLSHFSHSCTVFICVHQGQWYFCQQFHYQCVTEL